MTREDKLRLIELTVELLTDGAASPERVWRRVLLLQHVLEKRRGVGCKNKTLCKKLRRTKGAVSLATSAVEAALHDLIS